MGQPTPYVYRPITATPQILNPDGSPYPFENKYQYELGKPLFNYAWNNTSFGGDFHIGDGIAFSADVDTTGGYIGAGWGQGEFGDVGFSEQVPLVHTVVGDPFGWSVQFNASASEVASFV